MTWRFDEVDPKDSYQNAFVQDWLTKWMDECITVDKVAEFHGVPSGNWLVEDSVRRNKGQIYNTIEEIQGTYSHTDHEDRKKAAEIKAWQEKCGPVFATITHWEASESEVEFFDARPKLALFLHDMEPELRDGLQSMWLYLGNVNGGDSILLEQITRKHGSFVVEVHAWDVR